MIGFYVYPANIQPTKDNVINKDSLKFVPWCLYYEEFMLEGIPDGYIIMPTTYEPNKQGPFNISVSTDVDFTLEQQDVWEQNFLPQKKKPVKTREWLNVYID